VWDSTGVSLAAPNLSASCRYPFSRLCSGMIALPVSNASLSTAGTRKECARLSTHCPVLARLWVVCDVSSRPSMADLPTQNTDDIGARFGEPSWLHVLTRTTGVPK
jgi:hypothetical protein